MKFCKLAIALLLTAFLTTISYGANTAGSDMTSIIFAVSKRINESIILHYSKALNTNDPALKIVQDKLSSPFDLATRIAFCKEAFFLNETEQSNPIGYLPIKKESTPSTPMESILFITSELNPDTGEILVFISSVSPARFTVFSIDNSYTVNVLYDSFQKNSITGTTIGSVENITVIKKGLYKARERKDILNERYWPTPRQILISKTRDMLKIKIINEHAGSECDE